MDKLLIILTITSLLLLSSFNLLAQNISKQDSAAFKKDFEQLLKKYGFKSKGYSVNITSINQKGGQTAFIINNNYLGDTSQRHLTDKELTTILDQIKKINKEYKNFDSTKIEIYSLPLPESQRFAVEIKTKLSSLKYSVTTHYNLASVKDLKENFEVMPGNENCVVIIVQPLRNDNL